MSQQHTTQASGQGMLERVFKLREHGTTARTERLPVLPPSARRFTSFLLTCKFWRSLAWIPAPFSSVTICPIAAFGSIMMGPVC